MPQLLAPENGVAVRFYRIGHGDCFLLAMPKTDGGTAYVLIDCGYKPGSPKFVERVSGESNAGKEEDEIIREVVGHLHGACGGHLDLAIITHEHQDHANGIWRKENALFEDFTIDRSWFAWTESPSDPEAIAWRKKHGDTLLGIVAAHNSLADRMGADHDSVAKLRALIELELGADAEFSTSPATLLAAAKNPANSLIKQGMKLIKDKSQHDPEFLIPAERIETVPGTGIRAFILGPPKDEGAMKLEDPKGAKAFPDDDSHGLSFGAASSGELVGAPFSNKFLGELQDYEHVYGRVEAKSSGQVRPVASKEVEEAAAWRQIEEDWLYTAERLAIALNDGVNNTSLVVAFELPQTKKVLLFAADAQLGNWLSWEKLEWTRDDGSKVTAKDILGRTVVYKVGHHGSHNGTLNGSLDDTYPNLHWMGQGPYAKEFTAMITAVRAWAVKQKGWNHPLESIKTALLQKCGGRVFQTDTDSPEKPDGVSAASWKRFTDRCTLDDPFCFDYRVLDSWD